MSRSEPLAVGVLAGCAISGFLSSDPSRARLFDFAAFIASGRLVALGMNPYDMQYAVVADIPDVDPGTPNLNAPMSLLLFRFLAWVEPVDAARTWYLLSLVLYLLTAAFMLGRLSPRPTAVRATWLLASVGFWATQTLGQTYVPLMAMIVFAYVAIREGRYLAAGATIGLLAAVKPNFLVWPVLLLFAGHRRLAFTALGAALAFLSLPALVFGPAIYLQWLAASAAYGGVSQTLNLSLWSELGRAGLGELAPAASGLLLSGLGLWAWRRKPHPLVVGDASIAAMLLASPLGWIGNTIWMLPSLVRHQWAGCRLLSAALLAFPWAVGQLPLLLPSAQVLPIDSIYTLATVLALVAALPRSPAPSDGPDERPDRGRFAIPGSIG
ncbi:MAG: glycosyltransferase family 87 protein [Chloroflexota bacterium]